MSRRRRSAHQAGTFRIPDHWVLVVASKLRGASSNSAPNLLQAERCDLDFLTNHKHLWRSYLRRSKSFNFLSRDVPLPFRSNVWRLRARLFNLVHRSLYGSVPRHVFEARPSVARYPKAQIHVLVNGFLLLLQRPTLQRVVCHTLWLVRLLLSNLPIAELERRHLELCPEKRLSSYCYSSELNRPLQLLERV